MNTTTKNRNAASPGDSELALAPGLVVRLEGETMTRTIKVAATDENGILLDLGTYEVRDDVDRVQILFGSVTNLIANADDELMIGAPAPSMETPQGANDR
jgi:hypothetical protein